MAKYEKKKYHKVLFKAPFNKRPVSNEQWPCDDYREGDGEDPRFDTASTPKNTSNRKAQQLCAQVTTAINLALPESRNWILRDLLVDSVIPAPDSTQLLVALTQNNTTVSPDETLEHILSVYGWLRTEVAKSICRKRVPQLKFVIK